MEEAIYQLKNIGLRLLTILILAPFMGYLFLQFAERIEKVWKTGNRKKKWLMMCELFFGLAVIGGWLGSYH